MKKYLFILLVLILPARVFAISIDGSDDWDTSSILISSNSATVIGAGSAKEWVWKDKSGDQISGKADLTEFRVKSYGTNLYFLARFKNFTITASSYVTPMLQIAISYADEGLDRFMDSLD